MKKTIALMTMLAMVALLASSAQAVVITIDPTTPLSDYISVSEWNGTSVEGWTWRQHTTTSVSGGSLHVTNTGETPYVENRAVTQDTGTYKYLEFSLKLSSSMPASTVADLQFLWDTDTTSYPRFYIPGWIADDTFHTYQLNMTDEANWNGNLTRIRVAHPTGDASNSVNGLLWEMDYFRMSAVPEPATITLLLLGLPLALRRRRK